MHIYGGNTPPGTPNAEAQDLRRLCLVGAAGHAVDDRRERDLASALLAAPPPFGGLSPSPRLAGLRQRRAGRRINPVCVRRRGQAVYALRRRRGSRGSPPTAGPPASCEGC